MIKIQIVHYGKKWEESHQIFAKKYYNNRRRRVIPEYIYWKFRGEKAIEAKSLLLAISDKEVVGQLGLIPCRIMLKSRVFDAHWACDLMVDEKFRGKGIAPSLYTEAMNRKILLANDVSPSAVKSMERFGFKKMIGPSKLFFPFYFSAITEKKLKSATKLLGLIPNPFIGLAKLNSLSFDLEQYKVNIDSIDHNLISRKIKDDRIYVEHDQDYLTWRVGEFTGYQIEGEVFQEIDNFLVILRYSGTIGFIVEFICEDMNLSRNLIFAAICRMKKMGVNELKFVTHSQELISYLKSIGFIKYRRLADIIYCTKNKSFLELIEKDTLFEYTLIDCDENL